MESNNLNTKNSRKLPYFLAAFILLTTSNAISDTQISSKISLNLSGNGQLDVSTRYLTNYILRGADPLTGETGNLVLIKRNDSAVDFDIADIEWDGIYPAVDFKLPVFNTQTSTINLSGYSYPNDVSWQDSEIILRGASLIDLIRDFPGTNEERLDALVLFLMNTLTVAENVTEIASDATSANLDLAPSNFVLEKLRPLAEKINNYGQTLEEATTLLAFFDVFVEQLRIYADISGVNVESSSDYGALHSAYGYYSAFREGFSALNRTLGNVISEPTEVEKSLAKASIAKQYERLIGDLPNATEDAILDQAQRLFSSEFNNAATKTEQEKLILKFAIEPLGETLEAYEIFLKNQRPLDQGKIDSVKSAYGIVQLAKYLYSGEDILETAINRPQDIVPILFDLSSAVINELITIDNIEIASKKALQKATGADGRGSKFRSIGKAANNARSYMAAFEVGAGVGNKMIPLIWDLIVGENSLNSSIVNGQISLFGTSRTNIKINKNRTTVSEFTNSDRIDSFIAVGEGDVLDIFSTFQRTLLFDQSRSPWYLNFSFPPELLYTISAISPSERDDLTLCVRKILGNLDYSVNTNQIDGSKCGAGTLFGDGAFSDTQFQTSYNDVGSNALPEKFRVSQRPQANADYLSLLNYTVDKSDIDSGFPIQIQFDGFDQNLINHKIFLISDTGTVSFVADVSNTTTSNLEVRVILDDTTLEDADPIEDIVWVWGDGQTSINANAQAQHVYATPGQYEISVFTIRNSGQTATTSKTVDILPNSAVLPPINLSVGADDSSLKLEWANLFISNDVGFGSYTVYASTNGTFTKETIGVEKFPAIFANTFDYPNPVFGTNYSFAVTLTVNGIESELSEIVFATLTAPEQPDAPNAPANVRAIGDESVITVSWNNVIGADAYNVYVSKNPNVVPGGEGVAKFFAGRSSPLIYINADVGDTYYFVVTSIVGEGADAIESALSSEVNGSLAEPEVETPSPPTSISAVGGEDSISVDWSPVIGADSYNFYVSEQPNIVDGGPGVRKVSNGASTNVSFDTAITSAFYFVATSVVDGVESELSSEVSASLKEPEQPDAPTNVMASGKADRIIVTWNNVEQVDSYKIFISDNFFFDEGDIDNTDEYSTVASPFTITNNLEDGIQYYIAVIAVQGDLPSNLSGKVSASLLNPELPDPVVTSVSPLIAVVDEQVNFTLTGTDLPVTIAASLEGTDNCVISSQSSTSAVVTCTPQIAGSQRLFVAAESGGGAIDGTPKIIEVSEAPLLDATVTSLTPLEVTIGEDVLFTVIGNNLPTSMVLQLEENDNCTLQGEVSPTEQEFLCENVQSTKGNLILAIGEFAGEELEGSPFTLNVNGLESITLDPPEVFSASRTEVSGLLAARLSWSNVQDADGYNLYISTSPILSTTSSEVTRIFIESEEEDFSSLIYSPISESSTFFAISSVSGEGNNQTESELSASISVAALESESTIDAPGDVVAVVGDGLIKVTWTDVEAADSYNVYISDQPITEVGVAGVTQYVDDVQPLSITDVQPDTTYYIRVSTNRDSFESDLSEEVEVFFAEPTTHIDEDFESFRTGNFIIAGPFGNFRTISQDENKKLLSSETSSVVNSRVLPFRDYVSEQKYISLQFDVDLQDTLVPYGCGPASVPCPRGTGTDQELVEEFSDELDELFNLLLNAARLSLSLGSTVEGLSTSLPTMYVRHMNTQNPELGYRVVFERANGGSIGSLENISLPFEFKFEYYPSSGAYTIIVNQDVVGSGTNPSNVENSVSSFLEIGMQFSKINNVRFIIDNVVLSSEVN